MFLLSKTRGPSDPLGARDILPLVFLAMIGASALVAAQEIDNGSFEHADSAGEPDAWVLQARGFTIELDDSETADGGHALRISGTDSGGSALIKQDLDLGQTGFSGATLRGRIRTRNIASSATLVASLEGPDGRVFLDDMRDRAVAGDTEWQKYSIFIPGAGEGRTLTVGARVVGSGTAWFDDLELIEYRAPAPADMDLRAYVLEALSILRENYLHRKEVGWERIRERGLGALPEDATTAQAHAAVWEMLGALNDPHVSISRPRVPKGTASVPLDAAEPITVAMASGTIARVRVPFVQGSTTEENRVLFAEDAHEKLKSVDSPELCGWIVDLRDNTGGDMWPMLASIGPIAGPGVVGQFKGPEGSDTTEWIYRDGAAISATDSETIERTAVSIDPFQPGSPDLPVAVLVSANTASSGEGTAIAFIGRENTRVFGSATSGLATANDGYSLSDGIRIIFPIAYMADRDGNIHYPRIQPDKTVAPEDALDAAIGWLQSQPSCSLKTR